MTQLCMPVRNLTLPSRPYILRTATTYAQLPHTKTTCSSSGASHRTALRSHPHSTLQLAPLEHTLHTQLRFMRSVQAMHRSLIPQALRAQMIFTTTTTTATFPVQLEIYLLPSSLQLFPLRTLAHLLSFHSLPSTLPHPLSRLPLLALEWKERAGKLSQIQVTRHKSTLAMPKLKTTTITI